MSKYTPTVDQRDQYAAWQAAQNPDMTNAGPAYAGDASGYKSYLTDQYTQKYGAISDNFDWSPTLNSQAKASQLLQLANGYSTDFSNNQSGGQLALKQALQYDPNAKLENGNLVFDKSKLPAFKGGATNQYDKYGGLVDLTTNDAGDRVKNSQYVISDPNYGDYTVAGNLSQAGNDSAGSGVMGQLEKYMPYVTMALMSAGIGAGAGPALGGLISSGMKAGESLSMGQGVNWESILGSLAGMTGIPGAGALTGFIMNEMQRQKSGG
jgi:hypothetical protein